MLAMERSLVAGFFSDCPYPSATMDTTISPTAAAPPDVAASLCPLQNTTTQQSTVNTMATMAAPVI
jgi:hypothetical protein